MIINTLIILKPDVVRRRCIGEVLSRVESRGFKISYLEILQATRNSVEAHYQEHRDSEFFKDIVNTIASKTIVVALVEHRVWPDRTIEMMREAIGPYKNRIPGTIRHEFAVDDRENSIHASNSVESYLRELKVWHLEF